MRSTSFTKWLIQEKRDIFGFDRDVPYYDRNKESDFEPIKGFNIEEMMGYLINSDLGPKKPNYKFSNEIVWGEGPGSVRVWLGTKYQVFMDQLGVDLKGADRWFTKRVFQLDQAGYGGHEEKVAVEILDVIKKINEQPQPTPSHNYEDIENLVVSMTNAIKKTARGIFLYEGITRVDKNNYIIRLSLRGHGVETRDQRRVLENQTYVNYSPDTGVIRVFNYNIESPTGRAPSWQLMKKDTDWNFAPNQPRDEIIETIATRLHWY